jgi:hypothetical protein
MPKTETDKVVEQMPPPTLEPEVKEVKVDDHNPEIKLTSNVAFWLLFITLLMGTAAFCLPAIVDGLNHAPPPVIQPAPPATVTDLSGVLGDQRHEMPRVLVEQNQVTEKLERQAREIERSLGSPGDE